MNQFLHWLFEWATERAGFLIQRGWFRLQQFFEILIQLINIIEKWFK